MGISLAGGANVQFHIVGARSRRITMRRWNSLRAALRDTDIGDAIGYPPVTGGIGGKGRDRQ